MRRIVVLASICVILGVLSTYVVAWGLELVRPIASKLPPDRWRRRCDDAGSWSQYRPGRRDWSRLTHEIGTDIAVWPHVPASDGTLTYIPPAWALRSKATYVCAQGWPFRCLRWEGLEVTSEEGYMFVNLGGEHPLGVALYLPGFVKNTTAISGFWGLIVFCGPVIRRRRRQQRNLCEFCAYPIGGSPWCTECGAMHRRPQVQAPGSMHSLDDLP